MASSCTSAVRTDGIAVLTIDQADSRVNVLTGALWADLETAIAALAGRPNVKGLVLASAKSGTFIAGADLKLLGNAPSPNDSAVRAFIELGRRVLETLESLPFPTCAAIDGAALGGGLEVALACDIRAVGQNPKVSLGLPEVKLGLIPGWGGTQRLPRIIGWEAGARMISSGEPIAAAEAVRLGLAFDGGSDPVAAACACLIQVDREKERQRKRDPLPMSTAVREALTVMAAGAPRPLPEAIALETEAFLRLAGSPESKRLIGEFFASRKK
ncbi:MAG TPA: enoyl-CoA hydratase-related protein [Urbifossiella sp.]|nr:enoyl-CoA hydratase-related protein [Urbifossiella sp.]